MQQWLTYLFRRNGDCVVESIRKYTDIDAYTQTAYNMMISLGITCFDILNKNTTITENIIRKGQSNG